MTCANHPELPAVAFCRTCGKALCESCQRPSGGTIFCEEHLIVTPPPPPSGTVYPPGSTPYTPGVYGAPANAGPSPGLAFLLGLIPGVGAIYNGQYAKGLIHVVILGLLISIVGSDAAHPFEALFAFLIALLFFYMAFEAYHTAAKRLRGEAVDEFSSILPMQARSNGFPIGPLLLIVFGIIFLLNTLEIVRFYQILRWWPVFPIAIGIYLLVTRLNPRVRHE